MADGWVEFFDVETDEAEELFAFDRFKLVDYGCGVSALVKVAFFRDCAVDAVEDLFADFAFLKKLKEDTDHIKNEPKLLIAVDKTTNFYKLEPSTYNELLEKNITKSYKKALRV